MADIDAIYAELELLADGETPFNEMYFQNINPAEADLLLEKCEQIQDSGQLRITYDTKHQEVRANIPHKLHESVHGWLLQEFTQWQVGVLLPYIMAIREDIRCLQAPLIRSFICNHKSSHTEPDFAIVPGGKSGKVPSVVLECGWDDDESGMRLERDRQMWLHSAEGVTKVIILVKFRKLERRTVRASIDIWHPNELGVMVCEKRAIFPRPIETEPDPCITLSNLYGGRPPDEMNGETRLPFDIGYLRRTTASWILRLGYTPEP